MDDLISRQSAIEACLNGWNYDMETIKHIQDNISRLPSVQSKAGRWRDTITAGINETVCSVCLYSGFHHFNYCPYCGAKMEEIENE